MIAGGLAELTIEVEAIKQSLEYYRQMIEYEKKEYSKVITLVGILLEYQGKNEEVS